MSQYLSEAFKKLDTLNEETFSVTDSGLQDFIEFTEDDENEDIIDIIDVDAETVEDLEDSYIGKVILDCCVCHSKLYKDTEDVIIEDDLANAGEECPFCYANDGYKVVGQVATFGEEEVEETEEKETDDKEQEDADEPKDEKDIEEDLLVRGEDGKLTTTSQDGRWGNSKEWDYNNEELKEGIFGIKTKKEKEKEAKAKAEKEAQKQRDKELKDQEEKARQQSVADSWARSDRAKRDAKAEYNRTRSTTQGSRVSNTSKAGVHYSGGDYYTESYKDTHMIMGGDGSEVYTDEDLRKIWDDSHTSDPSMKEYKSFEDWKSDTISQMEELDESKSIEEDTNDWSLGLATRFVFGWGGTDNEVICYTRDYHYDRNDDKFTLKAWLQLDTEELIVNRVSRYLKKVPATDMDLKAARVSRERLIQAMKNFANKDVNESKSINEDINNLSLDTDDTHMEMTSDESGKVTITTEPIETAKEDKGETIEPVEPEIQNEIESNVANGEEIEIDVDEFDEESFDELGEGYLKKVYENVDSFKTSKVSYGDNKLVLEGVIKFNSGKAKKTTFLFENKLITKKGKVRFIGENKEIARGKKSFTITGRIDNKKFLSESFNYNYGVKTPLGKVKRLYGTINK